MANAQKIQVNNIDREIGRICREAENLKGPYDLGKDRDGNRFTEDQFGHYMNGVDIKILKKGKGVLYGI